MDKENTCLKSSAESWLTPDASTWHPNELNPVRKLGHGRGSLRGSSPGQTLAHIVGHQVDYLACGGLPWPSYLGEGPEMREETEILDS